MDAPATNATPSRLATTDGSRLDDVTRLDVDLARLDVEVARLDLGLSPDLEADASAIVAAVEAEELLSADQRAILDFERRWWRQPGAKEQAIRDQFQISPTRYYQALNSLLDLPQALSYDPTLINRLQRMRGAASRGRRRLS